MDKLVTSNFKTIRENLDLTRDDLARVLGVSTRTIWRYEVGTPPEIALAFVRVLIHTRDSDPSYWTRLVEGE